MVPMSAELERLHVISILNIARDYTDYYMCTQTSYFNHPKYILSFQPDGINFMELKGALFRYTEQFGIESDYSLDTMCLRILLHHYHMFLEYMQ